MIRSARVSRRSAKYLAGSLIGLIGLVVLASAVFAQSLTFPALTGRVVDSANLLDAATRSALTEKLEALEAKTTDQFVVVTLKSLQGQTIESYGYQLGRHWGIGQKDKNNGVLLIVAPNERKVRIEVGYGLEGTLTDALAKIIIENAITPRFRANDYAGGITRGVDDVIQVLSGDAELFKQQTAVKEALRKQPSDNWYALLLVLFWLGLGAFIIFAVLKAPHQSRGRGGNIWFVPIPGGFDRSWSSGSSGGFSGGGGDFGGGGGDFGGGGSSGSW
jgi:uncharacterized protein